MPANGSVIDIKVDGENIPGNGIKNATVRTTAKIKPITPLFTATSSQIQ